MVSSPVFPIPDDFYVGMARWCRSLQRIIEPLVPRLGANQSPWTEIFGAQAPIRHRVGEPWLDWLARAQQDRCFWCQHPLRKNARTLEHVLPYESTTWRQATRMEQLLSLRLSHEACNHAYAAWRQHIDGERLASMDAQLLQRVQRMVDREPIFRLYQAVQAR